MRLTTCARRCLKEPPSRESQTVRPSRGTYERDRDGPETTTRRKMGICHEKYVYIDMVLERGPTKEEQKVTVSTVKENLRKKLQGFPTPIHRDGRLEQELYRTSDLTITDVSTVREGNSFTVRVSPTPTRPNGDIEVTDCITEVFTVYDPQLTTHLPIYLVSYPHIHISEGSLLCPYVVCMVS